MLSVVASFSLSGGDEILARPLLGWHPQWHPTSMAPEENNYCLELAFQSGRPFLLLLVVWKFGKCQCMSASLSPHTYKHTHSHTYVQAQACSRTRHTYVQAQACSRTFTHVCPGPGMLTHTLHVCPGPGMLTHTPHLCPGPGMLTHTPHVCPGPGMLTHIHTHMSRPRHAHAHATRMSRPKHAHAHSHTYVQAQACSRTRHTPHVSIFYASSLPSSSATACCRLRPPARACSLPPLGGILEKPAPPLRRRPIRAGAAVEGAAVVLPRLLDHAHDARLLVEADRGLHLSLHECMMHAR